MSVQVSIPLGLLCKVNGAFLLFAFWSSVLSFINDLIRQSSSCNNGLLLDYRSQTHDASFGMQLYRCGVQDDHVFFSSLLATKKIKQKYVYRCLIVMNLHRFIFSLTVIKPLLLLRRLPLRLCIWHFGQCQFFSNAAYLRACDSFFVDALITVIKSCEL